MSKSTNGSWPCSWVLLRLKYWTKLFCCLMEIVSCRCAYWSLVLVACRNNVSITTASPIFYSCAQLKICAGCCLQTNFSAKEKTIREISLRKYTFFELKSQKWKPGSLPTCTECSSGTKVLLLGGRQQGIQYSWSKSKYSGDEALNNSKVISRMGKNCCANTNELSHNSPKLLIALKWALSILLSSPCVISIATPLDKEDLWESLAHSSAMFPAGVQSGSSRSRGLWAQFSDFLWENT